MFDFHNRYPKRHQLTTFDANLREIEFRLSLLPSDAWLTEDAWCMSGYALQFSSTPLQPGNIHAYLDTPPEPPKDDESFVWCLSMTPHIHRRVTVAIAEGLLGYALARPPPLPELDAYASADPFLADLCRRWSSTHHLSLSLPRPLHELLDPLAASLESYLTIDSIYARVDGPRPPRKRR